GIKIEATGQNIITVGDGNQVNARYSDVANRLAELKGEFLRSTISEAQKLDVIADIETVQTQLAKAQPDKTIIARAWEGIRNTAALAGLIVNADKVGELLTPLIS
ncbi:MAG TPA: hypothetical protein VF170_12120, partial [Planctomycetaceae bacterium]